MQAGKTILANKTCFNHAAAGGHAVYVTLLAESHSRMFAHLKRMAFFDESAIPDRVYYIGGYSALEAEGLDALVTLIRGAIRSTKRRCSNSPMRNYVGHAHGRGVAIAGRGTVATYRGGVRA